MSALRPNIINLICISVALTLCLIPAADCHAYPAECLYDSVFVRIKANYTAEIVFKSAFLFSEGRSEKYSVIRIPINSNIDFDFFDARTMLPDGRTIELNKNEIETISDFTPQYYPDSKSKIIYLPSPRPGARSEVAYRLTYKSLLYLPRFFRQRDIPTLNSYLQVKSEIPFSYFADDEFGPQSTEDSTLIFWDAAIPPEIVEDHGPPNEDFQIFIKPDSTVYMGHKYGFNSWADVAHFYNDLSEPQIKADPLSPIRELASSLVGSAVSRNDSLEALLDFVMENIRYISVDIGRGEFRPLEPIEVLNKRYGDCKDQAELLTSMCRALGFDANPALTATRDQPDIILSLPWPGYFNHVITAVDTGNGYLFLDASRPTCCFGNLPFALRNRRALICGGAPFLDFTLTSPFEQGNDIDINLVYQVNQDNLLGVNVAMRLYRDAAFIFQARSDDQVLSNVLAAFWGDNVIGRYRTGFRVVENRPDYIRVTGSFFDKLAQAPKSNRMMVNFQSPYIKLLRKYFMPPQRVLPYEFRFGFNIKENITLELTDAYRADKDSLSLSFNERGVQADMHMRSYDHMCEMTRTFRLFDYSLSPDRYNEFVNFLLMASQASNNTVELVPSSD